MNIEQTSNNIFTYRVDFIENQYLPGLLTKCQGRLMLQHSIIVIITLGQSLKEGSQKSRIT